MITLLIIILLILIALLILYKRLTANKKSPPQQRFEFLKQQPAAKAANTQYGDITMMPNIKQSSQYGELPAQGYSALPVFSS